VIIVADDEEADHSHHIYTPFSFLQARIDPCEVLNVSHDYRYQKMAYYVSMHAGLAGCHVTPSCQDILDAHRNPLLLARAHRAGIPCMPYVLKAEYEPLQYPVLCFAINPHTYNSMTPVRNDRQARKMMRSLTMAKKYAVSIQPLMGKVREAVQWFGDTNVKEAKGLARMFYEEFHVPIGKIIYQLVYGEPRLCHFEPARRKEVDWKKAWKLAAEAAKY
jgi:hypothetical protein